jgi:hypothetical protein
MIVSSSVRRQCSMSKITIKELQRISNRGSPLYWHPHYKDKNLGNPTEPIYIENIKESLPWPDPHYTITLTCSAAGCNSCGPGKFGHKRSVKSDGSYSGSGYAGFLFMRPEDMNCRESGLCGQCGGIFKDGPRASLICVDCGHVEGGF